MLPTPSGVVVLLSGGLDSCVLATALSVERDTRWDDEQQLHALSIRYGQRHARELHSATLICDQLGIEQHDTLDLSVLRPALAGHSSLTSDAPVPEGHYSDETMRSTIVHNRNAIMLMVAVGVAASRGMRYVATAVHAGDHAVYPDCRPAFIESASRTAQLGTEGHGDVIVLAPYSDAPKHQIVALGHRIGAPMHLSWSCYQGGQVHCGRCGTCVERAEAFALADVPDPTTYSDPDYWRQAVREYAR